MLVFILRCEGLHSSRGETLAGNSNSPVDQREKCSLPIGCERWEAPTGPFKKTQPVGSTRCSGASCLQHHLSLRNGSPSGGFLQLLTHSGLNFRAEKAQRRHEMCEIRRAECENMSYKCGVFVSGKKNTCDDISCCWNKICVQNSIRGGVQLFILSKIIQFNTKLSHWVLGVI